MVALARAFFGSPAMIVLDEPEAGLDAHLVGELRAAVARRRESGTIVLLVTHDPDSWHGIVTTWIDLSADGAWRLDTNAKGTSL